jgi:hypothetical protein
MRPLAILITALLAGGAALVLTSPLYGGTSSVTNMVVLAALALAVVFGGAAYWGGARWGAVLVLLAALLGAFLAQQNHDPLVVGPIVITSRPYAALGGLAAVVLLVVLSWRELGKRGDAGISL